MSKECKVGREEGGIDQTIKQSNNQTTEQTIVRRGCKEEGHLTVKQTTAVGETVNKKKPVGVQDSEIKINYKRG
jgi:hypothetical protein